MKIHENLRERSETDASHTFLVFFFKMPGLTKFVSIPRRVSFTEMTSSLQRLRATQFDLLAQETASQLPPNVKRVNFRWISLARDYACVKM